ncbi:MAG TPA: PQQ-binding-like beta-propeller repeat protein [Candidatus Limnocylindrales bacterium]|nr:PQQ-binding-like beta-propeller repeat protein [Candidatus Limnocylindrales bacterium]
MRNKKSLFALILVIVLAAPMAMQISETAKAQATLTFPTYLYTSVAPNPVGLGQTLFISLFFTKPVASPVAGGAFLGTSLVYYTGMTINIVKPDGTNVTLGPFTADATGGVGNIQYVPEALGNYTVQGFYPGQSLTGTTISMLPSMSPAVQFTVQQAAIGGYVSPSLPTNYWTRPIYATNYNWGSIAGNWLGMGRGGFQNTGGYDATGNNFNAWSSAPTTAHIMWTKPTQFGGQVGGPIPSNQMTQFTSTSILYHQFEPIILNGIVYYNWYPNVPGAVQQILAVDLRTGTTLWTKDTTDILAFGQVLTFHTVQEYGSQSWLWALAANNSQLDLYDPLSGDFVGSVVNLPPGFIGLFGGTPSAMYDWNEPNEMGNILIYYLNSTYNDMFEPIATSLTMWNSSKMMTPFPTSFFASTIRPSADMNFMLGIQWSVPVPAADTNYTIAEISDQAILLTSYQGLLPNFITAYGAGTASDVAFNAVTGQLLWGPTTQTLIKYHEFDLVAGGDGYYVRHDKDTNQAYGYSLSTGQQVWGPVQLTGNALSTLQSEAAIAYGKVYIWDFGGYVTAIDLNNGTIAWTFNTGSAGYNTPYGVYPIWGFGSQSIADGMLFLSEGRMYDPPLFPGAQKLAINCTTGQLVWSELGFYGRDASAISMGEMLAWNSYDGQIYAYGMGPSKTTVTAPGSGVTTATPLMITGTVTDISSGSLQNAVAMNFPNGLPCVSDASMSQFMQTVYMQQPMATNLTGVPVTISVTDSNGNHYSIGTAISDPYTGTFGLQWTPIVPGNYTVTASFAGTQSYYGSMATTYFVAGSPSATPAPTASPVSGLASTSSLELGIAAVIIVIIIIGAILAVLTLRKHP